ncbi:MAG: hypothetical protein IK990_21035 [Ruminiclostridium sp.]|nr:hypothetical protein [Ruminiclostridium sp.]
MRMISNNRKYTAEFNIIHYDAEYGFNSSNDGYARIELVTRIPKTVLYLYDENEKMIPAASFSDMFGNTVYYTGGVKCTWDKARRRYSGVLTYKVKNGSTYIQFFGYDRAGRSRGRLSFRVSFPTFDSA